VPDLTIRAKHAQLSHLLSRIEKAPPGRVEIRSGIEEVVQTTAEQIVGRETDQSASGRVRVDDVPCVVDDEHGVTSGSEECFGL